MSTVTAPRIRELVECHTPAEVLSECLQDIRDELWICNALTDRRVIGRVRKPKGCAVGMVALNSGNWGLLFDRDDNTVVADYKHKLTTTQWNDLAQQTVMILAQAVVEVDPDYTRKFIDTDLNDIRERRLFPEHAESIVINYNDGGRGGSHHFSLTKEMAEAWFEKALEIANR